MCSVIIKLTQNFGNLYRYTMEYLIKVKKQGVMHEMGT